MTRRSRTILFYSFVLLFLGLCPLLVLYSQGYRFDAANRKITQTGGFFLKIEPKQADIYLSGDFEKKTDFFFGSALIKNLIPKEYKIEVKKEGYQTWEKTLEVREKEVTEAKTVVLFPKNPDFNLFGNNVENFWFSPDQSKIIEKEIDSSSGSSTWSLKIYDPSKNVKSFLIDEKSIYQKGADLISLEFSQNLQEIYLETGVKEQIKYFTLNYGASQPALKEKATTTVPENVISYAKTSDSFYYLDNSGYLLKSDLLLANEQKINNVPLPPKQETEYKIIPLAGQIFIKENSVLYFFNPNSKSFEEIFEQFKNIKASPDLKNFLVFSENEIWIIPNQLAGGQTPKKIFLTRFSEKIGDIFWLNNDYLVFSSGNKIQILEIDDRDKLNIWDIGELKNPTIYFNQLDKKLYVLSEKQFYSSKPLLP